MAEARRMNWALVRSSYKRKNENNQTTLPFIKVPFLDLEVFIINFWEYHESKLSSKTFWRLFKFSLRKNPFLLALEKRMFSQAISSCRVLTQTYCLLLVKRNFGKQRLFYQCAEEWNFLDASFKKLTLFFFLNRAVKAVYFKHLQPLIFYFNLSDILTFLTCSFY